MWGRNRNRNKRKRGKTKRVGDSPKDTTAWISLASCFSSDWFSQCWESQSVLLEIPLLSRSPPSMRYRCCSHNLEWHLHKQLFPFSQFAMVEFLSKQVTQICLTRPGIFLLLPFAPFPQSAQWNLSNVLISNLHLHLGMVLKPPYLPSVLFLSSCCSGLSYENFLLWQCLRQFIVLLKSLHTNSCRDRTYPAGHTLGFIRVLVNLDLKAGVSGVFAQYQFDTKSCIKRICSIWQQSIDFFLTHAELIFSYTNYRGKRGGKTHLNIVRFFWPFLWSMFFIWGESGVSNGKL